MRRTVGDGSTTLRNIRSGLRSEIRLAAISMVLFVGACTATDDVTTSSTDVRTPVPASTIAATTTLVRPPEVTTAPLPLVVADSVYRGGTVLTMNSQQPRAEAVAVRGDKIMAVGTESEIAALVGEFTDVINLDGLTLIPGFVDAHTHLLNDIGPIEGQRIAAENGITTLGNLFSVADFISEMESIDEAGELQIRTSLYLPATDPCGERYGDWWRDYTPSFAPGQMLRIQGVKVFTDGGACGNPAISQPYPGIIGLGDLWFSQEELDSIVQEAAAAGFPVVMHAIGDRAVDQALTAMDSLTGGGDNPLRHRIDHNSIIRPDQISRYGESGAVVSLFGYHTTCGIPERSAFYKDADWPWRALLDANPDTHFAWHGDDPWVGPVSPLLELYSLVTRYALDEDGTPCAPPDWLASHAITVEEGLAMMTTGAAYALFRDEEVGSIEVGKYADFVVLSDDPVAIDPLNLKDVRVLATIVGNTTIYCADDATICAGTAPSSDQPPSALTPGDGIVKTVRASQEQPGSPATKAVDGDLDAGWVSGNDAVQWIELDLGEELAVGGIRLWVDQYPAGFTSHRILGGPNPDPTEVLAVLDGDTTSGDLLEANGLWAGIRYLRIETTESPSWVAWFEIEVFVGE